MKRRTKELTKGITLIALVVTIVVLLILAGTSIAMLTGENGIITQAKTAKEKTYKEQLKEELQMVINDLQMEKKIAGEQLQKKDIVDKLKEEAIIIDYTEDLIEGEYKDYNFTVDEKNEVIIGNELRGAKPTATFVKSTEEENVDSLELQVIGNTTEGEIKSIESLDGLEPKEGGSNDLQIYVITENKEYKFKIIGTNGRISIEKKVIDNIATKSESLLVGISEIKRSGIATIKVEGVTSTGNTTTEKYPLNVIYHEGNLTLGGKSTSNGTEVTIKDLELKNNNEWTCGNTNDIANGGAESQMAKNTVVLKVDGDLTLESGYKLTAIGGAYGGPKGLIIYCTGKFTNNGEVNMTARGAYAKGQNVYLWKNSETSYEYIASNGGNVRANTGTWTKGLDGNKGTHRACGSGGAGGSAGSKGGSGGAGTSWSGGSGGGGSGTQGGSTIYRRKWFICWRCTVGME